MSKTVNVAEAGVKNNFRRSTLILDDHFNSFINLLVIYLLCWGPCGRCAVHAILRSSQNRRCRVESGMWQPWPDCMVWWSTVCLWPSSLVPLPSQWGSWRDLAEAEWPPCHNTARPSWRSSPSPSGRTCLPGMDRRRAHSKTLVAASVADWRGSLEEAPLWQPPGCWSYCLPMWTASWPVTIFWRKTIKIYIYNNIVK